VYEFLEGEVAGRTPARLVLDVHGVGYDLCVPLSSPLPSRGRARVWTHLVVREDAHVLYGFPDRATRDLFRVLLTVRGVGPVAALALLSGIPPLELVEAVAAGDARRLTEVRGIGRKTADQILLDLRDKAARLRAELAGAGRDGVLVPQPPPARDQELEDAVAALVSIGYTDKEARKSVAAAAEQVGARDLAALVRAALSAR
jgi:Holliday junction DNA helicase RuvA